LLTSAVALACASSVKVQTEYDRATNFKGYKTYAWILQQPGPEQAPAARDPRIREAVMQGIDGALTSKGLTRVDASASPDLLVAVHGFANNRIEVQSYGYTYAATPYGFYPGLATPAVDVRQYRDGTLIIDLIDAGSRQMVWRGTATDTFQPGAEAKAISGAIQKTLAEYPPPAQGN
jgi:hypothetical protein